MKQHLPTIGCFAVWFIAASLIGGFFSAIFGETSSITKTVGVLMFLIVGPILGIQAMEAIKHRFPCMAKCKQCGREFNRHLSKKWTDVLCNDCSKVADEKSEAAVAEAERKAAMERAFRLLTESELVEFDAAFKRAEAITNDRANPKYGPPGESADMKWATELDEANRAFAAILQRAVERDKAEAKQKIAAAVHQISPEFFADNMSAEDIKKYAPFANLAQLKAVMASKQWQRCDKREMLGPRWEEMVRLENLDPRIQLDEISKSLRKDVR